MNAKPASAQPLVIAVPSKGRLQENAAAFFARAGLNVVQSRGARDYRGTLEGVPGVEVLFLSASEIARELSQGGAHFGITGEDLIRESIADADQKLVLLAPLGFGHANVVVAVPQAWIDVRTMADLEDVASAFRQRHGRKMRVATKYINLTRRYFAEHGVTDYRIVESLGATEGAPAAGTAELIVDITTTGATLHANALKVLDDGTMLKSEANLVASLAAPWTAEHKRAARAILARIAAEEEARISREVRASFTKVPVGLGAKMAKARKIRLVAEGGDFVVFQCPKKEIFDLSDALIAEGAVRIGVTGLDYVLNPSNPLIERLESRLS